jgi:hypothetical protein
MTQKLSQRQRGRSLFPCVSNRQTPYGHEAHKEKFGVKDFGAPSKFEQVACLVYLDKYLFLRKGREARFAGLEMSSF